MRLIPDKRKRLIELIEQILENNLESGSDWKLWAASEKRMIHVENELIHLLLAFLKKGKIIFREGQETEDSKELLSLLDDFRHDLEGLDTVGKEIADNRSLRVAQMINHRLQLLLESIHKEEDEMRTILENEFGLSEGKEWSFEDGSLQIEFHPKVRMTVYQEGRFTLKDEVEPYILLFDNDYLVAAIQGEFSGRTFIEESATETYIRYNEYLARTVCALFQLDKIDTWISQSPLSDQEYHAYLKLRTDPALHLEPKNDGFIITRKPVSAEP